MMPVVGFYLQPAVGGRILSAEFWRRFAALECVVATKIAPFNRYQTFDVVRAVVEAGRDDIALYTGNDDNIVADLLTPYPIAVGGKTVLRWIDGGLLGQWAVWTRGAVKLLERIKRARESGSIDSSLLSLGAALTDANAAVFDAAMTIGKHADGIIDGQRNIEAGRTAPGWRQPFRGARHGRERGGVVLGPVWSLRGRNASRPCGARQR